MKLPVGAPGGKGRSLARTLLRIPLRIARYLLVFLLVTAGVIAASFVVVRALFRVPVRRAPPWDCGFPSLNARMQDTAEGFGQPIRHMFGPVFRTRRELPTPFDVAPRYEFESGGDDGVVSPAAPAPVPEKA